MPTIKNIGISVPSKKKKKETISKDEKDKTKKNSNKIKKKQYFKKSLKFSFQHNKIHSGVKNVVNNIKNKEIPSTPKAK